MRVIWISIGIFITVFAIAFGLHDPDADSPFFASEQTKPQIENPFVEGEPENNQADLTASSENKQQENLQSNVNQTLNSQEDVAVFAPSNGAVDSIQKSADGIDNQTLESNIDQEPAVVAQSEPTTQKKQLGLLARSAELRRNANKVAVIVHQENDQPLTEQEIRAMYMDRLTHWKDGSKVMLYNLPLGDKHREKFSQHVLNMSALQADEAEMQRRDNNMAINPVRVKAKNIVVSYVERNPNAIAYVPLSLVRDRYNVKVVMTLADED